MESVRLHQLEGFYYTGLTGGYARAAAAMPYPITEPAIHQQVRKLERALGTALAVQAAPRRTALTPEGRLLFDFVAPFFRELPAVLRSVAGGAAGKLVVAAEGAVARELLASAVARLRERRPAIRVHVADREGAEVARMVRQGEADAGIAVLGLPGGGLRETPLVQVRVALCVPAAHPLARRRRPPAPGDLDGLPLCVYEPGQPGRRLVEAAFRAAGIALRVAAEATSVETLRALVRSGVAPAFVPVVERAGRRARRDGEVVAFDVTGLVPGERVAYGLVTAPDRPPHPALAELGALLARRGTLPSRRTPRAEEAPAILTRGRRSSRIVNPDSLRLSRSRRG